MRILMVSQWWPPEPATIVGSLGGALTRLDGNEVQVLTGYPNYPAGKIYPGYKMRLFRRRTERGVDVIRVPLFPSHSENALGRIANYISFGVSSTVAGLTRLRRPEVTYVYHPPISSALLAVVMRRVMKVPFLLHVQDLWPESVTQSSMVPGRARGLLGAAIAWTCNRTYSAASHIVVIAPGMKTALINRGVEASKISVLYNWADEESIQPNDDPVATRQKLGWQGKTVVLYAGNVGRYQGLDRIVRAAATIDDEHLLIAILGDGGALDDLKSLSTELGTRNVQFLERVTPGEASEYLQAADVHLVSLKDLDFFHFTIPGKTQVALAMGKPILMFVEGDAKHLVEEARASLNVGTKSVEEAIRRVSMMDCSSLVAIGTNGLDFYRENLSLVQAAEVINTRLKQCIEMTKSNA